MTIRSERVAMAAAVLAADSNVRHQYPIQRGQWIRHPEADIYRDSFLRYWLDFALSEPAEMVIHVSADNRFELFCDEVFIGMGPDRSDVEQWSFHAYRIHLDAGAHRLRSVVHFLAGSLRPVAQRWHHPGFVLYSEDSPVDLNTGSAPWQVTALQGVTTAKGDPKGYFVVGPNYTIDAAAFFHPPPPVAPVVVQDAGGHGETGCIQPGWKLYPSVLPEQVRRAVHGGRIRCVADLARDALFPTAEVIADTGWEALIEGRDSLTVGPHTSVTVLWDLEQYHTAYPVVTMVGGAGAAFNIEWAEACYIPNDPSGSAHAKGNRNDIAGKGFRGYGDTFLPDGAQRTFQPFWWRAGRYIRIRVETRDEPLTIEKIVLWETRMPLENESSFACDDAAFDAMIDVSVRGIQMCAHETYMDCPYYEQLMYVGDTRLQMLTSYIMSAEDRLNQRAIALFDWSRRETGFVLERYPSDPKQLSATFSMIWVLMLRDHAWWRNEPAFIKLRLKGMRCLLEEFKAHLGDAALLPPLPGWSFMDWVKELSAVNHPGPNASVSSAVNLLFLNALQAAADLEAHFGEAHLAATYRDWAVRLARAIQACFWNADRGLFAEDPAHTRYSEHAQCLALLSGYFPEAEARCFEALISDDDLLRTTVYFSFYLLETFQRFGRGDLIVKKLDFWKDMIKMGFKTPVEMPEPSRSDCHAWGSHPLFHMHASLAGIRPGEPGFKTVVIKPSPGPLHEVRSRMPHPAGMIQFGLHKGETGWVAKVSLPEGVEGQLLWNNTVFSLKGMQEIALP